MKISQSILIAAALAVGTVAFAQQQKPQDPTVGVSREDVAIGYNFIETNAPPGGCHCFNTNGGFISGDYRFDKWFSVAGEVTGNRAAGISTLNQNLTLMTYMAGPRVTWPIHRLAPFAEAMFGGVHGSDSYFPTATSSTTSASSFAIAAGAGVDINLSKRFAVRAIDAKFLHTSLPNGVGDTQNELELSTGLVIRFGVHNETKASFPTPAAPHANAEIEFTCAAANVAVNAGQIVQIIGETMTLPDHLDIGYHWSSNAGPIQGEGRIVSLDTSNLSPGVYRVDGHAYLNSDQTISANCQAAFEVKAVKKAHEAKQAPQVIIAGPMGDDFKDHVGDVFFDYDKWNIRSDAKDIISRDAAYLIAHPEITITLAGYADERGTDQYNIDLGLKRALEVRKALAAKGVDMGRMNVLSYGKEKPFCTATGDACYQQNRRAQLLHDK
jgi:peptidoglycan-associated lipoprotein